MNPRPDHEAAVDDAGDAQADRTSPTRPTDLAAWAVRFKPDEDLVVSLRAFCAEQGLRRINVVGAVGSLMQARLVDAAGVVRRVDGPGLEIVSLSGRLDVDVAAASLAFVVADTAGRVHAGGAAEQGNPVCVTVELMLLETT